MNKVPTIKNLSISVNSYSPKKSPKNSPLESPPIKHLSPKTLDYNKENDHQLKYYVYLGCLIGIVVFIAIIFFIQLYLH